MTMLWIVLAVYVMGLLTFPRTARQMLIKNHANNRRITSHDDLYKRRIDEERGGVLLAAFGITLIWPVALPVRAVSAWVLSSAIAHTPDELAESEREELKRLRRLAASLDLPMPDDTPGDG